LQQQQQPGAGEGQKGVSTGSTQQAAAGAAAAIPNGALTLEDLTARGDMRVIDRVRATCSILNIGELSKHGICKADQIQAVLNAARSRALYRANAYADDVGGYLAPAGAAPGTAAGGAAAAAAGQKRTAAQASAGAGAAAATPKLASAQA
jgi:hypothetical protein